MSVVLFVFNRFCSCTSTQADSHIPASWILFLALGDEEEKPPASLPQNKNKNKPKKK